MNQFALFSVIAGAIALVCLWFFYNISHRSRWFFYWAAAVLLVGSLALSITLLTQYRPVEVEPEVPKIRSIQSKKQLLC